MEQLVTFLGTIVASFFILSLAVETILENFRGILSLFGINVLKSQKTLESALSEAAEFVPQDQKEYAKFAAFVKFVEDGSANIADVLTETQKIRKSFAAAADPKQKNDLISNHNEWLAAACGPIRASLERSEEKRVFVLRILSAAIGIAISWLAGLNVIEFAGTSFANNPILGYLLAGLAAAGGSSFWHDQLDRVRSVKQIGQQVSNLIPARPN
ncbi:MAG: hypothetical protein KF914_13950 [Rhizobiaceae bacterium]|nr:hypothetical protein [Rhizobiaceae bacterium]